MTTKLISVSSTSPVQIKGEKSESKSRKGGKGKSNRQVFMSELMKRISGDAGLRVVDAYTNDRAEFKSLMIGIIGEMAKVDGEEE